MNKYFTPRQREYQKVLANMTRARRKRTKKNLRITAEAKKAQKTKRKNRAVYKKPLVSPAHGI